MTACTFIQLLLRFTAQLMIATCPGILTCKAALADPVPFFAQSHESGALNPVEALDLMLSTPDLYVVDTREKRYIDQTFTGAVNIPWNEMEKRYDEIPAGRTVLLHCGLGWVSPKAYAILHEHRPDLKHLYYIDGAPLYEPYNQRFKPSSNQKH